jgi:transcription termination/antitermination protein NusG
MKLSENRTEQKMRWYVVHTTSGHEKKVAEALKQRVEVSNLGNCFGDVLVPIRNKIVIQDGKKKKVPEIIFPGYLLVQMKVTDESWYMVRNTDGITGFIGAAKKPTPISDREVEAITKFSEIETLKYEANFSVGAAVKITEGPFTDFIGKVQTIDEEKGRLTVLVSIFSRETPVDLEFTQVKQA